MARSSGAIKPNVGCSSLPTYASAIEICLHPGPPAGPGHRKETMMYLLSLIIGAVVIWLVWTTLNAAWLTFIHYRAKKQIAKELATAWLDGIRERLSEEAEKDRPAK